MLVITLLSYVNVNGGTSSSSSAVTFAFLAMSDTFVPNASSVKNSVAVLWAITSFALSCFVHFGKDYIVSHLVQRPNLSVSSSTLLLHAMHAA